MQRLFTYVSVLAGLMFFAIQVQAQDAYTIRDIHIEGNKKTREEIILRELTFAQGDHLSAEELHRQIKRSEENLINTSLFHFAEIAILDQDSAGVRLGIELTERWYLWPVPEADIDERNFNAWWEHRSLDRISAGLYITQSNSRGRMELWQLTLIAGYNQQLGFTYEFPYINNRKTFGLGFSTLYSARHEVNTSVENDKQVFLKLTESYAKASLGATVWLLHRPNTRFSQQLNIGFQGHRLADSVVLENPAFSHGGMTDFSYLTMYYKLKLDHRNYKSYPLEGYYADIELQQDGLGLFENKELSYFSAKTTLRKYLKISDRWYGAAGLVGKVAKDDAPFLFTRGLGYNRDFVRGYEYYVVDGNSYTLAKANLKYALVPQRKLTLHFIPTEKFNTIPYAFYLNVFTDMGYVKGTTKTSLNTLQDQWLTGYGLGLDFVTYYDWVMRMEVSRNKMGESGFYLHFIAPI